MSRTNQTPLKIAAVFLALAILLTPSVRSEEPRIRNAAISPEESLKMLELDSDFSIQLIGHEPDVIDPVDAAFDDQGRLWVVEMRDYPYPTGGVPTGCVRVLTDRNGDGRFDVATTFADQLNMPTGIAIWKDGVVVTMAGEVVWMRDTDSDLKVDERQVWLEGFAKENEQLRANHPRLGPDGWWYIASGLRGGSVVVGKTYQSATSGPLILGTRDVRFDPSTGQFEAITGPAQFGLTFDTTGNRIFCTNRNPAVLVRFEQSDLIGNPLSGLVPSVVDVIPSGEQSKVFALVNAWTTSNLHAGQFTAACGVHFHDFNELAKNSNDPKRPSLTRIFACEPTGSLVHCSEFIERISPNNRLSSAAATTDWLASRDPWFRPVNVIATPDNGVAILDMHRAVIEHPDWVPDELKKRPDERWGNDCGRIYHVNLKADSQAHSLSASLKALRENPLGKRSNDELANLVVSDNPWMRDTARRILIERNDSSVVDAIYSAAQGQTVRPAAKIEAIYLACRLARQMPKLAEDQITAAIDEQPVNASVLLAALRASRGQAGLAAASIQRIVDLAEKTSNAEVFSECLRTIGVGNLSEVSDWENRLTKKLVSQFATAQGDELAKLLVFSASAFRDQPGLLLQSMLQGVSQNSFASEPGAEMTYLPSAASRLTIAALDKASLPASDATARNLPSISLILSMLKSNRPQSSVVALAVLGEYVKKPALVELKENQAAIWDAIRSIATSEQATLQIRAQSLSLLARSPRVEDREILPRIVQDADLPVQLAALRAWASTDDKICDQYLLDSLRRKSPKFQATALELIAQKQSRLNDLAKMIAEGEIPPKQIGGVELKKLITRAKEEAKRQLTVAVDSLINADRAKVIEKYQPCLELKADAKRGKELFAKHCSGCHKIDDVGVQVGPDISDLRTQQPIQILTSILDPNRVIDNNYFRYTALTEDDQVVDGIIVEETLDTIVIRGQNNTRTVLQRSRLQELKATGISMMPEGVESQIDQQAMADLVAYVKGWRYLDGTIPK